MRYSWSFFAEIKQKNIDIYTILLFIFFSFIIVLLNISLKAYEINKLSQIKEAIFPNIFISVITMGFFGIFFFFTKTQFARFVFFSGFLVIPVILTVFNKLLFFLLSKTKKPIKLLYFGSNDNFILLEELINRYSKWFSMDFEKILMNEKINKLENKIKKCDLLVMDTDQLYSKKTNDLIYNFEIIGGTIYSVVDIFCYLDQSLPAEIIKNNHYDLFSSYKLNSFYCKFIKRIIDVFLSSFLLITLSPLLLLSCILIKLTSKGKIIYSQERVTLKNKIFRMYKFRTMKYTGDNSINFTSKNDSRITFIGKILRPLRIDELPQLINILKGDMSFIGPRPERPELIEKIIKQYPLFKKRLLIKPGLTGWAQVKYTYVNKIEKMNKKLSYDLYYLNNLSFIFDMKILLYTLETVLFRRGAI